MKRHFLNAVHAKGTSYKADKVNGKPFDFTQVTVAIPFESRSDTNFQSDGFGWEVEKFDLDPMALAQFDGLKLGQEVDLIIEPQPKNSRRTWVTGRR